MPFHIIRDTVCSVDADFIMDFCFSGALHAEPILKTTDMEIIPISSEYTDNPEKISHIYHTELQKIISQRNVKKLIVIPFSQKRNDIDIAKEALMEISETMEDIDITLVIKTDISIPKMDEIKNSLDEEKLMICHLDKEPSPSREKRIFRPRILRSIQPYGLKDSQNHEIPKEDVTFSDRLFEYVREKDMTSHDFYKAVNIDRRLFSKMQSKDYMPSKKTALACCIALKLNEEEARELLSYAGYTFSRSDNADCIILYCIRKGNYDCMLIDQIMEMNGVDEKYYFFG